MGQYNSSLTRVQPIFKALQERDDTGASWLPQLWQLAAATRKEAAAVPAHIGTMTTGRTFERALPPSTAFLRWAVENPQRLNKLPPPNYGATGTAAIEKREQLFRDDPPARARARAEALEQIAKRGGQGSGQQWWAFEGFTHVDACFETEECLLIVEGKRTETVSPSTRWFAQRNQLWRNVEVAQELANGRAFGVILGVENEEDGTLALREAAVSRDGSYPHLPPTARQALDGHLLGFVVWRQIVSALNLPSSVLIETYEKPN
jgi:hypothetical protein